MEIWELKTSLLLRLETTFHWTKLLRTSYWLAQNLFSKAVLICLYQIDDRYRLEHYAAVIYDKSHEEKLGI